MTTPGMNAVTIMIIAGNYVNYVIVGVFVRVACLSAWFSCWCVCLLASRFLRLYGVQATHRCLSPRARHECQCIYIYIYIHTRTNRKNDI